MRRQIVLWRVHARSLETLRPNRVFQNEYTERID